MMVHHPPVVGGITVFLALVLLLIQPPPSRAGFTPCFAPSISSRYHRTTLNHSRSRSTTRRFCSVAGARASPTRTALGSADRDSDGPPSDEELSLDLQARVEELGLDVEKVKADTYSSESSNREIDFKARDDESEYIYVGGERFYLPSSVRSSLPTATSSSRKERDEPRRQSFDKVDGVTSRRGLLQEARPGIIGSLEGLALALSLFFILTVVATGGRLFAPFVSISDEAVYPSSSSTTPVPRQRIMLDPDTLLKEDFARDRSSVFYGQALQE